MFAHPFFIASGSVCVNLMEGLIYKQETLKLLQVHVLLLGRDAGLRSLWFQVQFFFCSLVILWYYEWLYQLFVSLSMLFLCSPVDILKTITSI